MAKQVSRNIFSRWLQFITITFYAFTVYSFTFVPWLMLAISFTPFWPLNLLAIWWTYYDRKTPSRGGRSSKFVRNFILYKYFTDYFPADLVKTAELDPNRNYIFVTHPHGVMCTSTAVNFINGFSKAKKLFPGLEFYTATLNMNFNMPFSRELILSLGFVSVSSDSLKYLMNDSKGGNVVSLIVGGAAEAAYSKPDEYNLVLKKRKGFIKVALETGCSVVPVFHFGENNVMSLLLPKPGTWLYKLSEVVKKQVGICMSVPVGRSGLLKFLPRRTPVTTVVGKPINLPKIAKPTQEEIDHYHSIYMKELDSLYNEHKQNYVPDPENTPLNIVE